MHAQKMLLVPLLAPPGSLSGPSWPHFWRGVLLLSVYDTESIKNPRDMLAWALPKGHSRGLFWCQNNIQEDSFFVCVSRKQC